MTLADDLIRQGLKPAATVAQPLDMGVVVYRVSDGAPLATFHAVQTGKTVDQGSVDQALADAKAYLATVQVRAERAAKTGRAA